MVSVSLRGQYEQTRRICDERLREEQRIQMSETMTEQNLIDVAERGATELDGASAEELLRWTDETFGGDYVVASNMQDAVLVAMAAKVRPGVDVLFLDTGYHFAETIGTRDAVEAVYG